MAAVSVQYGSYQTNERDQGNEGLKVHFLVHSRNLGCWGNVGMHLTLHAQVGMQRTHCHYRTNAKRRKVKIDSDPTCVRCDSYRQNVVLLHMDPRRKEIILFANA